MAGEPRRSGRATKGQHTKNQDLEGPSTTPKRDKKSKSKSTKQASSEPEDGEDDSIIRCICGATEDDQGWMMISCEQCTAWQHNLCMGVTEDQDELDKTKYYCEQCRPQDHKELLAAIARGEKPWEERQAQRKEEERSKSKKGKKGNRKSGRPSTSQDVNELPTASKSSPVKTSPPPETGTKRKFENIETTNGQRATPTAPSTGPGASQHSPSQGHLTKRSKSSSEPSRRASIVSPVLKVASLDQLTKERKGVAQNLIKEFKTLIENAVNNGSYVVEKPATAEALGSDLGLNIEHALHSKYRDQMGIYGSQFRAIRFNIKKNHTLFKRLLSGSLTPEDLATMSSEDMASEELQKERAAIKEEADKQAVLAHEEGPRYRKTHKGDELIEDDASKPSESAYVAPVRRRTIDETQVDYPIDTGSPPATELPEGYDQPALTGGESLSPTDRSGHFNIQDVWQNVQPSEPSKPSLASRTSSALIKEDVEMKDVDDPELSRLLKDDDINGPSSDPDVLWHGSLILNGIATSNVIGKFGCGGTPIFPYPDLLNNNVEIDGRIATQTAGKYLADQRYSTQNDVSSLILYPMDNDTDRQGFDGIFHYFKEKDRWGVISQRKHEVIRDIYVVPIEAGSSPLPEFITLLEQNNITSPRPANALLLTIIVRMRNLPSTTPTSTISQSQTPLHPQTPVNQSQPNFSPVAPSIGGTFLNAPASAASAAGATAPSFSRPLSTLEIQALGPFINTPVVKQIIDSLPAPMDDVSLQNLRDILERDPIARIDVMHLSEHIARRAQEGANAAGGAEQPAPAATPATTMS